MRGIIIAVPERYKRICLANLYTLRFRMKNTLPIELWQVGQELTKESEELFKKISNVTLRYVDDPTHPPEFWRGYQVKAYMLKHTAFDEVILADADIVFSQDPSILFDDPHYQEHKAYFFRDLTRWKFSDLRNSPEKFNSIHFFNRRKRWLRSLLPTKPAHFPVEWDYIYDEVPPTQPVQEALQESGCVCIDKTVHRDSIENIYRLNENYSSTYTYVLGDKETFWIGCLMANKTFYFNERAGEYTTALLQFYNDKLMFTQKPVV